MADRSFIWNRLCVFSGRRVALNACIVPRPLRVCVKQCYGVPLRRTCVNLSGRHVKTHVDVEHVLTFTMAPSHSRWDHGHKWCHSVLSCDTFSTASHFGHTITEHRTDSLLCFGFLQQISIIFKNAFRKGSL